VTGIESKAVIDGTSLSGAMSQDRFAFSSAHQGARRSQGAEIRELAGRAGLKALDWPFVSGRDDRCGPAPASNRA